MNSFAPAMASSFDASSKIAYPPTTSLASENGPSTTFSLPPDTRTFVDIAVGASPPELTIVPFLLASAPSLSIASINAFGGIPWFSACFTSIMNRISLLLCMIAVDRRRSSPLDLLLRDLLSQLLFVRSHFGRELRAKVFRLEHRTDLDLFALIERRAFQPLHGFFHRTHLPQPESGDQFLRLRERPIDYAGLAGFRELHPLAL